MSSRRARLIVNVDDLGLDPSIAEAAAAAHRRGLVTSTSLVVNMPASAAAAARVRQIPGLGVGVHLNLTQGRPVAPPQAVASLVGPSGEFLPKHEQLRRLQLRDAPRARTLSSGASVREREWSAADRSRVLDDVRCEVEAQIRLAIDLGIRPTHCDGHHGIHWTAAAQRALLAVLPGFGIRATRNSSLPHRPLHDAPLGARLRCLRWNLVQLPALLRHRLARGSLGRAGIRTPDRQVSRLAIHPRPVDPKAQILACLRSLPDGVSELILHLGSLEPHLESARFRDQRRIDSMLATDVDVLGAVRELDVELVSYADLE